MADADLFRRARDFLLTHREDYATAYREFRWPVLDHFNWALDWFDVLADGNERTALHLVEEDGREVRLSYAQLAERSNRAATYFRRRGVERGHRILMMLPTRCRIWEVMLAAMKLGAVVIPASTLLTPEDLRDRMARGTSATSSPIAAGAEKLRGIAGDFTRIWSAGARPGLAPLRGGLPRRPGPFIPHGRDAPSRPGAALLHLRAPPRKPKLVVHTHASYPVGHLSTMYWIGLREGDVHMNVSARRDGASTPGPASSRPFNAGATVFVFNYARFNARALLDALVRYQVTTFCAPPTVWRMLVLEDLAACKPALREALSRRRAAQPRGHRAGAERLGHHHPRRVRPDRDHGPDRQHARPAGQARLHGPSPPRLRHRAAGCGGEADRPRRRGRGRASGSTRAPPA